MVDLFYGDCDYKSALNALSSNVSRIRTWITRGSGQSGGPDLILTANRSEVVVEARELSFLDSHRFERGIMQFEESGGSGSLQQLEFALSEYRGPFMDGDDDDWILFERERFHCLFVRGQMDLMSTYARGERFEDALECGRRILKVDPLREYVHRRMMVLFAANGQRAAALQQFERCRAILLEECEIEPMPETVQLADLLQTCANADIAELLQAACLRTGDDCFDRKRSA